MEKSTLFRTIFVSLLLGTVLILFGFSLGWKTFKTYAYSIDYPKSWTVDQSGKLGTVIIFSSRLDSQTDDFAENVNLIVQDVSELDLTLNKFVEITMKQIQTMLPNGAIVSNERVRGKRPEFQRMIFTSTLENRKLKFEQYTWVRDKKAYVLTFSSEESQYDKHRKTAQKILNSFVFNEKKL